MSVLDDIVTDYQLAERLGCPVREIKRAWKRGRLKGTKLSTGLRFREPAIKAWLEAEEERCHESNRADLGSDGSPDGHAGTSTTTTASPDGFDDAALAQTIANELKRPSGSSSSNVRALPRRGRSSSPNATP